MRINWKVRFKNPIFWRNIAIAIVAPILAYFGLNWEQIVTWQDCAQVALGPSRTSWHVSPTPEKFPGRREGLTCRVTAWP